MRYKAYQFTKASIQFSDGREIDLNPQAISFNPIVEETREVYLPPGSLPHLSYSITILWSTLRFKVGPFWLPPPPLDRVN